MRSVWLRAVALAFFFLLAMQWTAVPAAEPPPPPIAARELMACAEGGDTECQRALADAYAGRLYNFFPNTNFSFGVPRDAARALFWYAKAAENGAAKGRYEYADALQRGEQGIVQDTKKAFRLFGQSAAQGYAKSRHRLGECYAKGLGVAVDGKKAEHWLLKAAAQREYPAYGALAALYGEGTALPRNRNKAALWQRRADDALMTCDPVNQDASSTEQDFSCYEAARKGNAAAQKLLGDALYINEDRNAPRAKYWYGLAANQGYVEAYSSLGRLYWESSGSTNDPPVTLNGENKEQYRKLALRWYRKSVEAGDLTDLWVLGFLESASGRPGKAVYWWTKGAQQGDPLSEDSLGRLYREGRGVPRDFARAAYHYRRAALLGNNSLAQVNLGKAYERGEGVAKDPATAMAWYLNAAELGSIFAPERLVIAYATGDITAKDPVAALKWGLTLVSKSVSWPGTTPQTIRISDLRKSMSDEEQAKAQQQADEWRAVRGLPPRR